MQYFSLNTNVNQLRIGNNTSNGIGKEVGRFIVTTMDIPWKILKNKLGKSPESIIFVESVEKKWIDDQIKKLPEFDCVIGIGGGMAIDTAKYISWKCEKKLVSIPTILSVDAFTTPAAGVRVNHEVEYLGKSSPDPLIIDYDVLKTAPKNLNIAGVGDLLSIHTASFDWAYANSKNKSEYSFKKEAINGGKKILDLQKYPAQVFTCTALRYAKEFNKNLDDLNLGKIIKIDARISKDWEKYSIHIIEPLMNLIPQRGRIEEYYFSKKGNISTLKLSYEKIKNINISTLGSIKVEPQIKIIGEKRSINLIFKDPISFQL